VSTFCSVDVYRYKKKVIKTSQDVSFQFGISHGHRGWRDRRCGGEPAVWALPFSRSSNIEPGVLKDDARKYG